MAVDDASANTAYLMFCAALVFLMQAGFTLLEAGSCRAKNKAHIIMKNVIDASVGALCWWIIGWGIAYGSPGKEGGDTFMGTARFAMPEDEMKQIEEGAHVSISWFFQYAFCATAATITKGGMAERVRLEAYLVIALILCTVTYPTIVRWTWGYGWLSMDAKVLSDDKSSGFHDFAGSGIVHLTGGITALYGAIALGPRIGRFDGTKDESEFVPHDLTQVALGTLLLWFGWYGFNCGSTLGLVGAGEQIGRCAVTTTLGAAAGGVSAFIASSFLRKQFDLVAYCNGILSGLVSITAATGTIEPGFAVLAGVIGGFVYVGSALLLEKAKIDDPIGAFPVHGACGIWGCMAAGLFDMTNGWIHASWDLIFLPNLLMCLMVIVWCAATVGPALALLKILGFLRVDAATEESGFDASLYGATPAVTPSVAPRSKEIVNIEMPAEEKVLV